MSEIIVLNRFRDDCVLVTHQDSFGNMDSMAVDFPKIRDRDEQFAIALAHFLRATNEGWYGQLYELMMQNERDLDEEIQSVFKEYVPSAEPEDPDYIIPDEHYRADEDEDDDYDSHF